MSKPYSDELDEETIKRLQRYYREDTEYIKGMNKITQHLSSLPYGTQLSLFEYFRLANNGLASILEGA